MCKKPMKGDVVKYILAARHSCDIDVVTKKLILEPFFTMLEGEPSRTELDDDMERLPIEHPLVTQFLVAIRSACDEQGIDFKTVLLSSDQEILHSIAHALDALYRNDAQPTPDDVARMLNSQLQLQLRRNLGQGGYVPLKKIPRLQEKPGNLTFATLSKGETAPRHKHISPLHKPNLPGEITGTLHGTLRYRDGDNILTHTRNDPPRISPNGSMDDYLPQEDNWCGFYIQFRGSEAV